MTRKRVAAPSKAEHSRERIDPQRLFQARKDLNLRQMDLASRANVPQGKISQLESDDPPLLHFDTACRLADALGVSLDWLRRATDKKKLT